MGSLHIDRLLEACIKMGGSDLHLVTDRPPVLRISGRLRSLDTKVLGPEDTVSLMKSITPEKNQQEIQENGGTDFGFAFGDAGRFRTSVFRQKGNLSLVLRLIPSELLTFDTIGLPEICAALCRRPRGLFLVTGPTGSGKTTTLASMIDYINVNLDRHIITVEEPIEYYHTHKQSIINQREVGIDVKSFADGLRIAPRQDIDVILVGEMRDLETISLAVSAAERGLLVFGTLHTNSAAKTIDRIIDVFPIEQRDAIRAMLAQSLKGVCTQTLCKNTDGRGRSAAVELLVSTPALSNIIREGKTSKINNIIQTGADLGMQLMDDSIARLHESGMIDGKEAYLKAFDKERFQQ